MSSSGCISTRQIHYYTLGGVPSSAQMGGPRSPALVVGLITASVPLQDSRIWYRSGANEAGAYEYQRWREPPAPMVRESLIHALRSSGKYRCVQSAGS
ncbi:MAG: ABC-type transport auxiliary lipoprotein family protein, partial [Bryobacteraceae bacterium]